MTETMDFKLLAKTMEAPEMYDFLVAHPAVWADILNDKALAIRMLDQLVRDARHNVRAIAHNQMLKGDTAEDRKNRMVGRKNRERLFQNSVFNWTIYGGQKLVDCTAGDLRESVINRRKLVDTNARAADFEEIIAGLIKDSNKRVKDKLTAEVIRDAHSQVYGVREAA